MRERPILFSAPMVRAILDGRKTMTRRAIKPYGKKTFKRMLKELCLKIGVLKAYTENIHTCPYGKVGDRLWVRETWRVGAWKDYIATKTGYSSDIKETIEQIAIDYLADNSCHPFIGVPNGDHYFKLKKQSIQDAKKAGIKTSKKGYCKWDKGKSPCRIRPSIHMPRWASRINLEITAIRVERLQDISEDDAKAEGVELIRGPDGQKFINVSAKYSALQYVQSRQKHESVDDALERAYKYKPHFAALWESINGAESWDANPWVWVVEFKRVELKGQE